MNRNTYTVQLMMTALLIATVLFACRKEDIMPEPVGEPVPYSGADKTWQQLIDQSSYTYFQQAWKRSGMEALVKKYGSAYYTFFIPTDKAFQDAGWTLDKINTTSAQKLDTLLSGYVVPGRYLPVGLEAVKGNRSLPTLAERTDLPNYTPNGKRYVTFLFAGKHNDSLYVNGTGVDKWGNGKEAINGMIYPVTRMIARPEKTMWQYLTDDPRFFLFTEAMRINDSLYQSNWLSVSSLQLLIGAPGSTQATLFAPTNAAFNKHGMFTVDDVRDYCTRVWPLADPEVDENYYYQEPVTSLDSLLLPHGLLMYRLYIGEGGTGPVFFSNDLVDNGSILTGITLMAGQMWSSPPVKLNLAFSSRNDEPMIKRLGSSVAPVGLTEKNVRVTNGVIHAVDDLFMP